MGSPDRADAIRNYAAPIGSGGARVASARGFVEDLSDAQDPQRGACRALAERARPRSPRPSCSGPGAITRAGRVEDGTTVCDFEPEEQKRHLSLSLALAPFEWEGHKVNLIDTPGYADFIGDVHAALRVADLAVFVVSAVDGVEVQTEAIWRIAAELEPAADDLHQQARP